MRGMGRALLLAGTAALLGGLIAGPVAADDEDDKPRPRLNKAPRGFKTLFNGKDLKNWQGLIELPKRDKMTPEQRKEAQAKADESARTHWTVQDGVLVYDGKGQSLQTAKDYGNFEFYVDWKILPDGDSGIYLRGNPQVQIWGRGAKPAHEPDGTYIGSGGLYNNQKNPSKPLVAADNPEGEWNTFFIRMVGDRVTVKLNDKLVVDNVPLENYWERGKPLPAKGPIELQHHGNRLEFRNIYIKELPDSADASTARVTLNLSNVPLAQVIQLLAANGGADIVLTDPENKLADRPVSFLNIRERSLTEAIEMVCRAAGLDYTKDASGVYYLSLK